MIKAVIFDLDGLLIDSERISYRIYQELLKPFGIEFSLKEYAENYSGKSAVKNMDFLIETYHLPWKREEGLKKVGLMEKEFLALGVDLKRGAKELLRYLEEAGYKTAMASSSIEDRALKILDQHGIRPYFDTFVFGHEVCLVLEDSMAGIQAAHAAHIPVICIPDMKTPDRNYADMALMVLDSLSDVISYLQEKAYRL